MLYERHQRTLHRNSVGSSLCRNLVSHDCMTLRNSTIARHTRLKRSTKSLPRTKKTPLAALKRQADKLAGELCRRRGACEKCGGKEYLSWAHMVSRRYHATRWEDLNSFCLCRNCHAFFTYNPDRWIAWLMKNHAARYLLMERQSRELKKWNRWDMEKLIADLQTKLA